MSRDPRASFWIIVYFAQLFTKILKKILRDKDKCGDSRKWKKHWFAVQKNWNFEKIHFFGASLRVFEYIKPLSRISNSARQSAEQGAQAHQITGAYGNGEARKLQRKVKDRNTKNVVRDGDRTRGIRDISALYYQLILAGLPTSSKTQNYFKIFSPALGQITLKLAQIPNRSVQQASWKFHP